MKAGAELPCKPTGLSKRRIRKSQCQAQWKDHFSWQGICASKQWESFIKLPGCSENTLIGLNSVSQNAWAKQRHTISFSKVSLASRTESAWMFCGMPVFFSLEIQTAQPRRIFRRPKNVPAEVGNTRTDTPPLTATILNINQNLNIAVHRSRHMLFINKSQMWARRRVHNLGGRTVMQYFRGVLKHVALTKRRGSAAAAGIPPDDATAWF